MGKFFLLSDPIERRALRIASVGLPRDESLRIRRGQEIPRDPIRVVATGGSQLRDFLWPSSIVPTLVRSRVIDLFVSEALTGWDTFPVEFVGRDGLMIPDYVGLVVTGRCGDLEGPSGKPGRYRFEHDSWDDSDFFQPRNTGQVLITSRVERAMRAANVRNVLIEPMGTAELPFV